MNERIQKYRDLAKQGDAQAQFYLGFCYETEFGVEESIEDAIFWYGRSAEKGNKQALKVLLSFCENYTVVQGECLKNISNGEIEKALQAKSLEYYTRANLCKSNKKYNEAIDLYKRAAVTDHADSQYQIGLFYKNGCGVELSPKDAIYWFEKAEANGLKSATEEIALSYLCGNGLELSIANSIEKLKTIYDDSAIVKFVEKSGIDKNTCFEVYKLFAEKGNLVAQNLMGYCYCYGEGVKEDEEKALFWYKQAAERGNAEAQYNLGMCFKNGWGVDCDLNVAQSLFGMAVSGGVEKAQREIDLIREGKVVPKPKDLIGEARKAEQKGNYTLAIKLYNSAIDEGKDARMELAKLYIKDTSVEDNFSDGIDILCELYEEGEGEALTILLSLCEKYTRETGSILYNLDIDEVISALEETAESYYDEGDKYYFGNGVEKSYEKAVSYYELSAITNHPDALYSLGFCYNNGIGVDSSEELAFKYYLNAVEYGSEDAILDLVDCYIYGKGTSQNIEKALKLLKDASNDDIFSKACDLEDSDIDNCKEYAFLLYKKAADKGNVSAQNQVGVCYLTGQGIPEDNKQAAQWFKSASDQNLPEAQYNLGLCYESGWGVDKDIYMALSLYRKSAANGNVKAQEKLDKRAREKEEEERKKNPLDIYYKARRAESNGDLSNAFNLYKQAAELGVSDAQNSLAICYLNGRGCSKDVANAVTWFTNSAAAGNIYGKANLATRYYNGEGVEKNYFKAYTLYSEAANAGNAYSQDMLGVCYQYGRGVVKNLDKAISWYTSASDKGYSESQYNLALLYENELNDFKEAKKWLNIAIKNGNTNAESHKKVLLEKIENAEIKDTIKKAFGYRNVINKKLSRWGIEKLGYYAEKGYADAMYYWGIYLEERKKFSRINHDCEALEYYRKSRDAGFDLAKIAHALLSYKMGLDKNDSFLIIKEFATKNNPSALYFMGDFYANEGINLNYDKAREYFAKAKEQGYSEAGRRLNEISEITDYNGLIYEVRGPRGLVIVGANDKDKKEYEVPSSLKIGDKWFNVYGIAPRAMDDLKNLKTIIWEPLGTDVKWRYVSDSLQEVRTKDGQIIYRKTGWDGFLNAIGW